MFETTNQILISTVSFFWLYMVVGPFIPSVSRDRHQLAAGELISIHEKMLERQHLSCENHLLNSMVSCTDCHQSIPKLDPDSPQGTFKSAIHHPPVIALEATL